MKGIVAIVLVVTSACSLDYDKLRVSFDGAAEPSNVRTVEGGANEQDGSTGGAVGTGGTIGSGGGPLAGGSGGAVVDPNNPDAATLTDATDTLDVRDVSTDHLCPMATFTFESGTSGARLGTMTGTAAKSVTTSPANRYCGQRSLEITTTFSGNTGPTTKGEVLIDLTGALYNLTGKTVTVNVSAIPEPMPSAYVVLTLMTSTGNITLIPSIRPLTSDWTTQSYRLPTASDAGVMMVTTISIQIFDTNSYDGKIYVDDLDIR